jgi:hypothetical protein
VAGEIGWGKSSAPSRQGRGNIFKGIFCPNFFSNRELKGREFEEEISNLI